MYQKQIWTLQSHWLKSNMFLYSDLWMNESHLISIMDLFIPYYSTTLVNYLAYKCIIWFNKGPLLLWTKKSCVKERNIYCFTCDFQPWSVSPNSSIQKRWSTALSWLMTRWTGVTVPWRWVAVFYWVEHQNEAANVIKHINKQVKIIIMIRM